MTASSNIAGTQPWADQPASTTALAYLSALQSAHRQIMAAMADLESIAAEDVPDIARFNAVRLRISQANLARARVARQVCTHLVGIITTQQSDGIRALQRRDVRQLQHASALVRDWTPDAVVEDWDGYRDAANDVRDQLRMLVAAEKQLVYPLLYNAGRVGRSARCPSQSGSNVLDSGRRPDRTSEYDGRP